MNLFSDASRRTCSPLNGCGFWKRPAGHMCAGRSSRRANIEASARRKSGAKCRRRSLAVEAVRRLHALFEIERGINGKNADEPHAVRHDLSRPLVLEVWMRAERSKLARGSDVAKGHGAHAEELARLHALSRPRTRLPGEQRCRTRPARHRPRQKVLVARRIRSWRLARCHPDRHGGDEPHRSAGSARRCACPHSRTSGQQAGRASAAELAL